MKVLKIFLRLNWNKIFENSNSEILDLSKALCKATLAVGIIAVFVFISVGVLGYVGYNFLHIRFDGTNSITDAYATAGAALFIALGILGSLLYVGIKFFKWICSNWKEAKRIAQQETSL